MTDCNLQVGGNEDDGTLSMRLDTLAGVIGAILRCGIAVQFQAVIRRI